MGIKQQQQQHIKKYIDFVQNCFATRFLYAPFITTGSNGN